MPPTAQQPSAPTLDSLHQYNQAEIDETTRRLLAHLNRGGKVAYFWTLDEEKTYVIKYGKRAGERDKAKQTHWYNVGTIPKIPSPSTGHVYFGVHPVINIPTERIGHDGQKYTPKPQSTRPHLADIAAINCLFGEFDDKDFANGRSGVLAHIANLPVAPSIKIDSGGGIHSYWLLDTPHILTDNNRTQAKDLQNRWVQFVGSDDQAKDLARVLRVPGRRNIKPQYAPDYPIVNVIEANFDRLYSIDELAALIPNYIQPQEPVSTEPFIPREGNFSAYVWAAYEGEIEAVRAAPDGQKHHTVRNAAIKLAGLLWTDVIIENEIENGIYEAVEGRAQDKNKARQTILDGIAYGKARPRKIQDRPMQQVVTTNLPNSTSMPSNTLAQSLEVARWSHTAVSAKELQHKVFNPQRQIVQGLILEGLTLLAGKPKTKKSWLALNIAIAVARGSIALGNRKTTRGEVLYLDLESNQRRMQRRLETILGERAWPESLHIIEQARSIDTGLIDQLEEWMIDHPDTIFIIADVFQEIKPTAKKGAQIYDEDRAAVKPLRDFANRRNVAVLLVHHTRKAGADDIFDEISGSTGLTGGVDNSIILCRDKDRKDGGLLHVRGRDLETDDTLQLTWNNTICCWVIDGIAPDARITPERKAVITLIQQSGPLHPAEIADRLGKPYPSMRRLCGGMIADMLLTKDINGNYKLPDQGDQGDQPDQGDQGDQDSYFNETPDFDRLMIGPDRFIAKLGDQPCEALESPEIGLDRLDRLDRLDQRVRAIPMRVNVNDLNRRRAEEESLEVEALAAQYPNEE